MMQMRVLRMVMACSAMLWLSAMPTQADDRVFLLQLGSFESESEARARWLTLQDAYPELLQGLSVRLLDVTLPPDNFTVYRTQAGALSSRADAEIICQRLASSGDECYVVETAMFDAQQLNAPRLASSKPTLQTLPLVIPAAPQPSVAPIALDSFNTQDIAQQALEQEMQSMDRALAEASTPIVQALPNSASEAAVGLRPDGVDREESFWSWINPFSSAPSVAQSAISAAPQPNVRAQIPDLIELEAPAALAPGALPAAPNNRFVSASNAPHSLIASSNDDALSSLPLQLPPPPAPPQGAALTPVLNSAPSQLSDASTYAPQAPRPVLAAQASAGSLPAKLPFQVKRKGQLLAPAGEGFVPAGNEVMVAEAVPVPLSDWQRSGPSPATASQLQSLGMPSGPEDGKVLWAEIQYFETQQTALAFWDNVRKANVQMPPMRVRITNPYVNARSSQPRVSLRVGPFAHVNQIGAMCAMLSNPNMRCHTVRDLGASASAGAARANAAGSRQTASYRERLSGNEMYWVQLGGYDSAAAAQAAWQGFALRHAPLLGDFKPSIQTPNRASTLRPVYRLRAGPYSMLAQAEQLCSLLQAQGTKCLTVFAN